MSEPQNIHGVRFCRKTFVFFFRHEHPKAEKANLNLRKAESLLEAFFKTKDSLRPQAEEQQLIITVAKGLQPPPFSVILLQPVTLMQLVT